MLGTKSLRGVYALAVLGGTALVAYFQALGANKLVEASLLVPMLQAPPPAPPPGPPVEPPDTLTAPLPPPPAPELRPPEIPELRWSDAPDCPGYELSIVSQAAQARASAVTVRRAGDSAGRLLHPGSQFGEMQLLRVGYDGRGATPAAWFVRDETLCQLRMFSPRAVEVAAATVAAVERAAPRQRDSIQELGPGSFQVDKGFVDRLLADPKAARDAQAQFERTPEGTFALRFRRVRPGGWGDAIGLRAGDRLLDINGFELKDPRHAIEAYGALRLTRDLTLKLERAGQLETIQIAIRE